MSIEFKINTYLNRYTFQVLSILKKNFLLKKKYRKYLQNESRIFRITKLE